MSNDGCLLAGPCLGQTLDGDRESSNALIESIRQRIYAILATFRGLRDAHEIPREFARLETVLGIKSRMAARRRKYRGEETD